MFSAKTIEEASEYLGQEEVDQVGRDNFSVIGTLAVEKFFKSQGLRGASAELKPFDANGPCPDMVIVVVVPNK